MSSINSETVVAFLKLKGWEESKKDDRYVCLAKGEDVLYIPHQKLKSTPFYELSVQSAIRTIGAIYGVEERHLVNYFTKSIDEIGRELNFHKAILAHAS